MTRQNKQPMKRKQAATRGLGSLARQITEGQIFVNRQWELKELARNGNASQIAGLGRLSARLEGAR